MDILAYVNDALSTEGENHIINYDMTTNEWRGVIESENQVIQLKKDENDWELMVAEVAPKTFVILRGHGEMVDQNITPTEMGITDLDTTGKRTEGLVADGKPCGYNVVYDEEGCKMYEGFLADGKRVCWGIDYYGDLDAIKYKGCYLYGMKHGYGALYDRNGVIEFDGMWNEDTASPCDRSTVLESHLQSISLSSNDPLFFDLNSWMNQLESISIGNNALKRVHHFELSGLSELSSIQVGTMSLTTQTEEFNYEGPTDGICLISYCTKLKRIVIGEIAFSNHASLKLENLPSLSLLDFQDRCFTNAASFKVRSRNACCVMMKMWKN